MGNLRKKELVEVEMENLRKKELVERVWKKKTDMGRDSGLLFLNRS